MIFSFTQKTLVAAAKVASLILIGKKKAALEIRDSAGLAFYTGGKH